MIALTEETYTENEPLLLFDPIATWKKTQLEAGSYTMKEILVPVFQNGQCIYETPKVMDIRTYCKEQLNSLWDESKRLVNPHNVYVDLSKPLYDMKNRLLDEYEEIKGKH